LKLIVACTLVLISVTVCAQQRSLGYYQWKNRVILIFGEQRNVTSQYNTFDKSGLNERNLIVIGVTNQVKALNTKKPAKADLKGLTEKFQIPQENGRIAIPFKLILIGKDGTAKFSSEEQVTPEKIYEIIDAMPMRKREMKKSSDGDSLH
jgi:hypothetical protein